MGLKPAKVMVGSIRYRYNIFKPPVCTFTFEWITHFIAKSHFHIPEDTHIGMHIGCTCLLIEAMLDKYCAGVAQPALVPVLLASMGDVIIIDVRNMSLLFTFYCSTFYSSRELVPQS